MFKHEDIGIVESRSLILYGYCKECYQKMLYIEVQSRLSFEVKMYFIQKNIVIILIFIKEEFYVKSALGTKTREKELNGCICKVNSQAKQNTHIIFSS